MINIPMPLKTCQEQGFQTGNFGPHEDLRLLRLKDMLLGFVT
jgi:hypothetical protein